MTHTQPNPATLRACFDEIDRASQSTLPTPILDTVRDAVGSRVFDLKRGAMFSRDDRTGGVSADAGRDDRNTEITIYGTLTVNDRSDSAARVVVNYWHASGAITVWCKATAWDGRRFADLPAGARQRAADTVWQSVAEVCEVSPEWWQSLHNEASRAHRAGEIRSHLYQSARELRYALDMIGGE